MVVRRSFRLAANSALFVLTVTMATECRLSLRPAFAQVATKAKAADQPADAPADSRAADRAAIAASGKSFVEAFQARDAEALAAHWTAEGEYENDTGATVRGREALAKAFGEFFAKTPEVTAEMRPESLRFLGRDTAIGEGSVVVQKGPALPTTTARYNSLLVREEGRWRFAKLTESAADEPSLEDLSWLIGEWKSTGGGGAEIQTIYAWSPNKKFIHVDFTLKEKGLNLSGKQVIGLDPATGQIRTWTFEADGGVGQADWSRDGDHWVLEMSGTLADGRSLSETNVLRRLNEDAVTWQSINRLLDGDEFPDLPPVKVTRVKAPKAPK